MIRTAWIALLFAALPLLPAQVIDIVGGTNSPATNTNLAKANLFRCDTTVLLTEFEMYLNVPIGQTVTFFSHRHHSRTGVATLDWTMQVPLTGGLGPSWYTTGPIALPLIGGNHYTFGVSWPGSLTYYYSVGPQTGIPVSFGAWLRAHTIQNPLPPTLTIPAGVDVAVYHQRLTTIPLPAVTNVGTGCSTAALLPRLVANGLFSIGTTRNLELVDAAPQSVGVYAYVLGPTLPVPIPVFGCSLWVDIGGQMVTNAFLTSAAGYAVQPFPVPPNPLLIGLPISVQAAVLVPSGLDFSNAIDFVIS